MTNVQGLELEVSTGKFFVHVCAGNAWGCFVRSVRSVKTSLGFVQSSLVVFGHVWYRVPKFRNYPSQVSFQSTLESSGREQQSARGT